MKTFKEFLKEDEAETDSAYELFFQKALEKFKVDSPDELSDEKKEEFFDYVDKNWKADDEEK